MVYAHIIESIYAFLAFKGYLAGLWVHLYNSSVVYGTLRKRSRDTAP